jgi:hypothetical protein
MVINIKDLCLQRCGAMSLGELFLNYLGFVMSLPLGSNSQRVFLNYLKLKMRAFRKVNNNEIKDTELRPKRLESAPLLKRQILHDQCFVSPFESTVCAKHNQAWNKAMGNKIESETQDITYYKLPVSLRSGFCLLWASSERLRLSQLVYRNC